MNAEHIVITTRKKTVKIKNRWHLLSKREYLFLVALLAKYASGEASPDDVRFHFLCNQLQIDPRKFHSKIAMSNLIIISEKIDFIFTKSDKINLAFAANLIPSVKIGRRKFLGYKLSTGFNVLTTNLTAAQFIEAQELISASPDKLPLIASILYCPLPYSSSVAHDNAPIFAKLNPLLLQAIAMNFQAVIAFLFTRTHFSILTSSEKKEVPEIATGLAESLYNLSQDGLGDIDKIKNLSIIEYLTILRKKLIESVRAMKDAEIDIIEISEKTGLSTKIIKKML